METDRAGGNSGFWLAHDTKHLKTDIGLYEMDITFSGSAPLKAIFNQFSKY